MTTKPASDEYIAALTLGLSKIEAGPMGLKTRQLVTSIHSLIARVRAEQENVRIAHELIGAAIEDYNDALSEAEASQATTREQAIRECADKAYEYLSEDTNLARLTKGLILALLHAEEKQ